MLSVLKTPDGRELGLALTTNASLLAKKAQALKDAGLRRVTVSLDSLDEATFKLMNDVSFPAAEALQGIAVAHRVGIGPIKVNRVVKQGINDQDIVPMARHFKGSPLILCFIEYMDVGATNGWKLGEVIPSAEVVGRIWAETALEEIAPNYTGETSLRWRYQDGSGEIGIISSVTQTFCHSCTR
ncbi:MAG: cyclic pyranopterin phosphate synthase, partial [Myxococcota bacterium]